MFVDKFMFKYNNLDMIFKVIEYFRFLDYLDISENFVLNFIELDVFIGLESIVIIDLRDCNIFLI